MWEGMFVCFDWFFFSPFQTPVPPAQVRGRVKRSRGTGSGPSAACQAGAGGSFTSASPPLRNRRSPLSGSATSFVKPLFIYRR